MINGPAGGTKAQQYTDGGHLYAPKEEPSDAYNQCRHRKNQPCSKRDVSVFRYENAGRE